MEVEKIDLVERLKGRLGFSGTEEEAGRFLDLVGLAGEMLEDDLLERLCEIADWTNIETEVVNLGKFGETPASQALVVGLALYGIDKRNIGGYYIDFKYVWGEVLEAVTEFDAGELMRQLVEIYRQQGKL